MANEVTLQSEERKHPVDENLRPIKVGGKSTSIDVAQHGNGAKINGDLEVTGDIKGNIKDMVLEDVTVDSLTTRNIASDGNFELDAGADISLDAGGGDINLVDDGTTWAKFTSAFSQILLYENAGASTDDYFRIRCTANGATILTTVDAAADSADLTIDVDGDITLNSQTGCFIAENAGTEFSATKSAYAGMILGYTVIGLDATPAKFDVTAAMLPVHDDLKVSFVFPPSGKVEIMASIYVQTDSARPLTFGLSTTNNTTGFTSLGAKYENHTIQPDETDGIQHTHRWYVTGSAGDAEELWFAAGSTHTNRYDLYWGGDSSSVADSSHPMEYQPFVMKATALPATTYTG